MARSIEQVLGYVFLTGVVETVKAGVPKVLPDAFWANKKRVIGDAGEYTQIQGTRQTAKQVLYGAPARRVDQKGVQKKPVKLLHSFEEILIDPLQFQALLNYDSYELPGFMAQKELERQLKEFARRQANLEIMAVTSMLMKGLIWFADGNLLPSSSGADLTIDFAIPANNKNQLNGIIAASWATTTTDIPLHIRNLHKQSLRDSGYPIVNAFYGENIPTYFYKNDYVKEYLARNPGVNQKFVDSGEIPNGLFGIQNWVPVYKSFYADQNEVVRTFVDGDAVTFTPEINEEVYDYLEGTYPVPNTFQPMDKISAAMYTLQQGTFAYAVATHNPVGALQYQGNTFLPVWKVINSIYQADCTP